MAPRGGFVARAVDNEAPYFVDYVSQELQDKYADATAGAVDVYTTLDPGMQAAADRAVAANTPRNVA